MKKNKTLFVLSFLLMSFMSLTSCSDGYYHPDLPEYTPNDSTDVSFSGHNFKSQFQFSQGTSSSVVLLQPS